MKIAIFTDEQGQIQDMHGPGVFVIFEKTADGWERVDDVPFSISDGAGLAEMRRALANLEQALSGVRAVIVNELRGILCASVSAMGIGVWKSDGTLAQQLTHVEAAMEHEQTAPPPEPSTCGGGGGGGRCGETRRRRSCNCCGC
jgi:Fe-only nitrogenase accessory protein AnfO